MKNQQGAEVQAKPKRRKIGWIVALSILMALVIAITVVWYAVAPGLDENGMRYLAVNFIKSYFMNGNTKQVKTVLKKTDGWVAGVCHPYTQPKALELMAGANIRWLRDDLSHAPYYIDEQGNPLRDEQGNVVETTGYKNYKAECKYYVDHGFKIMCVTQYPDDFYEDTNGLDFRPDNSLGEKVLGEMAEYIIKDFAATKIVHAIQVTNEMGIDHFMDLYKDPQTGETEMITLAEGAKYIGVQLKAMYPYREDIIIGYNLAGWSIYSLLDLMKPYHQYCDYIGLDWYAGSFENIQKSIIFYEMILRGIYGITKKPLLVNEFGYIGYGQTKSSEEKAAFLQEKYGYDSEAAARADAWGLFSQLTTSLQQDLRQSFSKYGITEGNAADVDKLANLIFDSEKANHVYMEIQEGYQLNKYQHTPEGQAAFFTDCIALFAKLPFVAGCFVYHFSDGKACYVCDQVGCPVETGWGMCNRIYNEGGELVDFTPQPCWETIRDAFAKALQKRNK